MKMIGIEKGCRSKFQMEVVFQILSCSTVFGILGFEVFQKLGISNTLEFYERNKVFLTGIPNSKTIGIPIRNSAKETGP